MQTLEEYTNTFLAIGKDLFDLHTFEQTNLQTKGPVPPNAVLWEEALTHFPECRLHGVNAEVGYQEIFDGPFGARFTAALMLAEYRAGLYETICAMHVKKDKWVRQQLEMWAAFERMWSKRFQDKMGAAIEGKKLEYHSWLN